MLFEKPIPNTWLDKNLNIGKRTFNLGTGIFCLIILFAIISRLYQLGDRPLSHDESIHLYYSYLFAEGQGYTHTPLSHGPLQFHLIALLFHLFGSSDFIGRIPHAVSSILVIVMLWQWRQYLGRSGTLITSLLMVISPFMLYYGRYARNESIVILLGMVTLFSVLRYLETKKTKYLFIYTAGTAFHFTVKETAFIYVAQLLVFLLLLLLLNVIKEQWIHKNFRNWFAFLSSTASIMIILAIFINYPVGTILLIAGLAIIGGAVIFLLIGYEWKKVNHHPAFDILILTGTFVLPMLTAFPVVWLGWNPMDYQFSWPGWILKEIFIQAPAKTGLIFLLLVICSIVIGTLWGKKNWLFYGSLFWAIYILFFTSFFSNPLGFFTGSIGSLGYWIEQQSVHRGNQPFYYYLLVQLPLYEFLPFLGIIPAIYFMLKRKVASSSENNKQVASQYPVSPYLFPLFVWWFISSLFSFSLAGEKMPWLTAHISLPMILLTGLGLGRLVDSLWYDLILLRRTKSLLPVLCVSIISILGLFSSVLGLLPLGSGLIQEQQDLSPPTFSIYWLFIFIASLGCLTYFILSGARWKTIVKLLIAVCFLFMTVLTARTSIRAAFYNFGNAYEYLVYAHGTDGIKTGLSLISDISQRVSGGFNDIRIAYDSGGDTQGTSWPLKWYMRIFSKSIPFYTVDNTLLGNEVIIADSQSYIELYQVLGSEYYQIDTVRIVWPNQDYFNLVDLNLFGAVADPIGRNALFQIWYSKQYSWYSEYYNKNDMVSFHWSPSDPMRMYIKKDVINKLWEYNVVP